MKARYFMSFWVSLIIGMTIAEASQSGWKRTGGLERATAVFALTYADFGNIYAGTEVRIDSGVVFKSVDKGKHWEPTGDIYNTVAVFSIIQASDGALYCGTQGKDMEAQVFKSIDYGGDWVPTGVLPGTPRSVYSLLETKDGALYAGTNLGVYKSTNKGETWTTTASIPGGGIRALLEIPDGTIYTGTIVGTETTACVYKSTNGGDSWDKTGELPADKVAGIMSLFYTDETIYAGTSCIQDTFLVPRVFKSSDKGNSWISLREIPFNGGEGVWGLIKTEKGILYAGTVWGLAGGASRWGNGKIFWSSDDMTWTFSDSFPESNGVSSFIQTPDKIIYAGITGSGVTGAVYKNISELYQPDNLIALNSDLSDTVGADIYNIDGTNQTKTKEITSNDSAIFYIKIENDGGTPDTFFVKGDSGGEGWDVKYYNQTGGADITDSIIGGTWKTLALAPAQSQEIKVEVKPANSVVPDTKKDILITSTSITDTTKKDAVKASTEVTEGVEEISSKRKFEFWIDSSNPCKAVVSVKWMVPGEGLISLEIYDATGRVVRTLARTQSQGSKAYTVVWNGKDDKGELLPSGVYFVRLKTEGSTLTRKVVIIR